MNIAQTTNLHPSAQAQYIAQQPTQSKPLTMEIDEPEPRILSLSGEGIYLSELAERLPNAPKIPQSSIKILEFDIKLMQQMKTQRLSGQSKGNNVEDLAIAYDSLQKNLNENSESSQKHSKFLNDAFQNVARLFFTQDAYQQHQSDLDFSDETQIPKYNEDAKNRLNQVLADAEKKAVTFADSFIKNYKKHGLDAYSIAMSMG